MRDRYAGGCVRLAFLFGLLASPLLASAGLPAAASTPLTLMEDFLTLREQVMARPPATPAKLNQMREKLDNLAKSQPAGVTADLQLALFLEKGYVFLSRMGGTVATQARAQAQSILDALRPAPRNCTYLDSGGIKVIFRGDPNRKDIALTYDDGPIEHAGNESGTRALLKVLAEYDAKATFFLVGQNAKAYPRLVQMERAAGHTVANHTLTHARGVGLPRLSVAGMRQEVGVSKSYIQQAGGGAVRLFRLPYGAGVHTARVNEVVGEYHPFNIFWTIDTNDWRRPSYERLVGSVLNSSMLNGAIVLMHDHTPQVVAVTRRILQTLKPKGFHFITMDEMLGIDQRTAFLEGFEQAVGQLNAGKAQGAFDLFMRLGQQAPNVSLAREVLDFAYMLGRTTLSKEQAQAAKAQLAKTFGSPAHPAPAPTPASQPRAGVPASPSASPQRGLD